MSFEEPQGLGALISVHGVSAASLQRAIFIAILSFLFFLAMMIAFYLCQNIGYFLLSTAFLLVYLFTLFSWVRQRRDLIRVYDRGIAYRKRSARWSDITEISDRGVIGLRTGKPIVLPATLDDRARIIAHIRSRAGISAATAPKP